MMKSYSHLEKNFYQKFILLIVLPLLLVIGIALGFMRDMMLESAVENIRLMHSNIVNVLEAEISEASLSLAHFLHINKGQAFELISKYNKSNSQTEKYDYLKELNRIYNAIFKTKNQVITVQFIFKDGSQVCLNEDVIYKVSNLRKEEWYAQALENKERVTVSYSNTPATFSTSNRVSQSIPLVVAFAPDQIDRDGLVEMVLLYTQSQIPNLFEKYNALIETEAMLMIDQSSEIMYARGGKPYNFTVGQKLREMSNGEERVKVQKKDLYCVVTPVDRNNIEIASASDVAVMLADFNRTSMVVVMIACFLFTLFFLFSRIFLSGIVRPVDRLNAAMQRVRAGELNTHVEAIGQKELQDLTLQFNKMTKQIQELLYTTRLQETQKHQAEMRALQSQINPHFLVNTLNTMRFMAIAAKFDAMRDMSDALIKILSSLFKHQSSCHTLQEEIHLLKSYIYLMAIRYSENFLVEYNIDPETEDCLVPRLILQPIVENSITHGLATQDDIGHIFIKAQRDKQQIYITIQDDGIGMTEEKMQAVLEREPNETAAGIGIGISNVHRRIQLLYGREYGIKMKSELGKGTTTFLNIPVLKRKEEINENYKDINCGR